MTDNMSANRTLAAAHPSTFQRAVCDRCGEAPVAPDRADFLSKRGMIRYGWTCAACGHRFTTESPAALGSEEEQEAVKAFWPSLLVG